MYRFAILLIIVSTAFAETIYAKPAHTVVVMGSNQPTKTYVYADASGNVMYTSRGDNQSPTITVLHHVVVQQTVVAPTVVQPQAPQTVYVPRPRRYAPVVNDHYNTRYTHSRSHYQRPIYYHSNRNRSNDTRIYVRTPQWSFSIHK